MKLASSAEVEAARLLLSGLGIDAGDLALESSIAKEIPTFSSYIPCVSRSVSASTRRAYLPYWKRLERSWVSAVWTSRRHRRSHNWRRNVESRPLSVATHVAAGERRRTSSLRHDVCIGMHRTTT